MIRRDRSFGRRYALGFVLIGLGIASAATLFGLGMWWLWTGTADMQRVPVPSVADVYLTENGSHVVYFEYAGATSAVYDGGLYVHITAPDGTDVPLQNRPRSAGTYDIAGHTGRTGLTFEAARPGTYRIVTQVATPGHSEVTAAIGREFGWRIPGALLGALVAGVLGVGGGVLALVLAALRRGPNHPPRWRTAAGPRTPALPPRGGPRGR